MAKRVLVVDDDRSSADTTVLALGKMTKGEIAAEASYGGAECLQRVKENTDIELILLDLNMPEVNGADVIRALLKEPTKQKLKVLPMTAWGADWIKHWNLGDVAGTEAFTKLVMTDTCDKTLDLSEMVEKVDSALG